LQTCDERDIDLPVPVSQRKLPAEHACMQEVNWTLYNIIYQECYAVFTYYIFTLQS